MQYKLKNYVNIGCINLENINNVPLSISLSPIFNSEKALSKLPECIFQIIFS